MEVRSEALKENLPTIRIAWGQPCRGRAEELFEASENSQGTLAEEFLLDALGQGQLNASVLHEEAEGVGISKTALHRASVKLGVLKTKEGFQGQSMWSLSNTRASNIPVIPNI